MKIRCVLTNSNKFQSFCGLDNSIYTVKISKQYDFWYYDLCDMIGFYEDSDIDLILDISDADIKLAKSLYGNHKFNENAIRDYEPDVLVHSTTLEAGAEIIKDGVIKCWNLLKQEKEGFEDKPIGCLLGDIDDFSNYVMLSGIDYNNEIIIASKQKGRIDTDPNQAYKVGYRFYLDARALASDGLLMRDGQHIKVKSKIPLKKYLIWYTSAEKSGLPDVTTPAQFFEASNKVFKENIWNI